MPGKGRKKKERRPTKSKFLCLVISTLLKVSGTNRIDLALEQQREVVRKLLNCSAAFFLGAAPIPYIQVAILNLLDS